MKCHGLEILSQNVNAGGTIELHLQNQSYYYTIKVQKEQCLAFIFLLGGLNTDIIKTEYKLLKKLIVLNSFPNLISCTNAMFMFFISKKIH